jgi:glycosyltransferase involved in cell wall biosynthesis
MNPDTPSGGSPRLRILMHFRTRGTGAEGVHLSGMAGGFESQGADVVFSSPTGADPRSLRGGNPFAAKKESLVSRISRRCPRWMFECLELAYNAAAWRKNRGILRKATFDFIYERHAFFLFSTARLARKLGVPLVVEVNELAGDARIRQQPRMLGLAKRCDRAVFRQAALIVVVSPHLARRAAELGADPQKILVLPNAVESSLLENPRDGAGKRAALGISPEEIVIGFVGWFVDWHRLDLLLGVVADICRSGRPVRLMMVGEGPLRQTLHAQAEQAGIAGRIVWTGAVSHDEVPDFVAAFDIAVVPHSNEYRSPIKLFEYMALGRAVAAPRLEPIESVVGDSHAAILFEPENAASLADALLRLVDSPEKRRECGRRGRALVESSHTWDKNARQVIDTLGLTSRAANPGGQSGAISG